MAWFLVWVRFLGQTCHASSQGTFHVTH